MPPKASITREQVFDAAFELVRSEGLEALSARNVARWLGCSTQPIYRVYGSMDDLQAEVLEEANQVALEYLIHDQDSEFPFLQVGLGNLRFAREEPNLYRALTMAGPILEDIAAGRPPPDIVLERMRSEPMLADLTTEQLTRIHALLWFFGQGLASLFFSEMEGDPMALAEGYLILAGQAVISAEMNRSEG